jgi:hypothetical protein
VDYSHQSAREAGSDQGVNVTETVSNTPCSLPMRAPYHDRIPLARAFTGAVQIGHSPRGHEDPAHPIQSSRRENRRVRGRVIRLLHGGVHSFAGKIGGEVPFVLTDNNPRAMVSTADAVAGHILLWAGAGAASSLGACTGTAWRVAADDLCMALARGQQQLSVYFVSKRARRGSPRLDRTRRTWQD